LSKGSGRTYRMYSGDSALLQGKGVFNPPEQKVSGNKNAMGKGNALVSQGSVFRGTPT